MRLLHVNWEILCIFEEISTNMIQDLADQPRYTEWMDSEASSRPD